jgi:hypothetical protein
MITEQDRQRHSRYRVVGDLLLEALAVDAVLIATRHHAHAAMACEAKWTACWLEPHMRLRLTAGTVTGKPASITPSLPTFAPCSPAWVTVPFITSSIFSASNPARCKSPSSVCARRASGRTSRKAPPLLANGVRTASRIIGSLISVTICFLLL